MAPRFAAPCFPLIRRAVIGLALACLAGCATGPAAAPGPAYLVFFTPFSADLDDAGNGVIADASQAALAAPRRRVIVAGYADSQGAADTNKTLSALRAQVVADGLVGQGVERARIVLRPKGQQAGDPGVEGRRVAIELD